MPRFLCSMARVFLAPCAVLPLLLTSATQGADPLPSSAAYEQRQAKALVELASRLDLSRNFGDRGMVRFGQEMVHLLAALEVHDQGLPGGTTPAAADAALKDLVPHCIQMLGMADTPGPWSWERSGSPAIMHAALALALIVHRWGDQLSAPVIEGVRSAIEDTTWAAAPSRYLANGQLSVHAARLLAGEFLGRDSTLWKTGTRDFDLMYAHNSTAGALEMNAPIYTVYHWPPLVLLCDLNDPVYREKARVLLNWQLTVHGHLFLPGGGLGAPRSRDRSGGHRQQGTLPAMFWLFFGEEAAPYRHTWHHIMAAGRTYRPPPIIRSFFVDKPRSGYSFWTYTDAPVQGRMPGTGYQLGPEQTNVTPWQTVTMPDGCVQMGTSYGHRYQAIHVSMGVCARDDKGGFQLLYHYQPWIDGDQGPPTAGGKRYALPSTNGDTDPDDFCREGYEYERLMYERTLLSLWNPRFTHWKDTRVHLPNWDRHGGQMQRVGPWYLGRMHQSYIAYCPLGEIAEEQLKDDGTWTYLRLDGPSGCVIELATVDQFATLEDYANHLQHRLPRFVRDPLQVEFEALDPKSKALNTVPLRLEFSPERRIIGGKEVAVSDFDPGFIHSPFVSWSWESREMRLQRDGYPGLAIRFAEGRVRPLE